MPQQGDNSVLAGYLINVPYRTKDASPLSHFQQRGIAFPDDASLVEFEAAGFATIWIGPDHSALDVAQLVGTTLENGLGAVNNPDLAIRLEFGY